MAEKVDLSFERITQALNSFPLPKVDAVVGIATGGLVPASLLAHKLSLPLYTIRISFRDEQNNELYDEPEAVHTNSIPMIRENRILLVDDVSVTGDTMQKARSLFPDKEVVTFVMKGKADLSLFPDIRTCVNWPWNC